MPAQRLMAIGRATGENRAVDAAQMAIASPLLDLDMTGARGVLFNLTGGTDLSLWEVNEAAEIINKAADPDANIIFGAVIDPRLDGEILITVIATGFGEQRIARPIRLPTRASEDAVSERPMPQAASSQELRPAVNDNRPAPSRRLPESDNIDIPTFLRRRG